MRLLLDTHVWLWLQSATRRIDEDVRAILADPRHELWLSMASVWEIALKFGLGKLDLPEAPEAYLPDRMRRSGVTTLAIEFAHAVRVASLPHHHRDPFDRMLIAQALTEELTIVTADPRFEAYGVNQLPVR